MDTLTRALLQRKERCTPIDLMNAGDAATTLLKTRANDEPQRKELKHKTGRTPMLPGRDSHQENNRF